MTNSRLLSSLWARVSAHSEVDWARDPVWQEVVECYFRYADETFCKLAGRVRAASEADVEDAVHEAFLKYYSKRSEGETIRQPGAWLYIVALNYLRDRLIEDRAVVFLDQDDERLTGARDRTALVDDVVRRTQEERRFAVAITDAEGLLTPFQRRCFRARLANRTYRDIAREEGRTVQGVAYAVNRACMRIRRYVLGDE